MPTEQEIKRAFEEERRARLSAIRLLEQGQRIQEEEMERVPQEEYAPRIQGEQAQDRASLSRRLAAEVAKKAAKEAVKKVAAGVAKKVTWRVIGQVLLAVSPIIFKILFWVGVVLVIIFLVLVAEYCSGVGIGSLNELIGRIKECTGLG